MKKVLIIEDNELNITILIGTLGKEYDLSVALDAEEAYEALEDELPDLILLDIILGTISGIEICKQIKSDKRTAAIPVMFLTAANDILLKKSAVDAGGDGFMTKPFKSDILREKIQTLIKG